MRTGHALLLLLAVAIPAAAAASAQNADSPRTALDRYVSMPDDRYSWTLVATYAGKGVTTFHLDMISQEWRTPKDVDRTEWEHRVLVVKPHVVKHRTAFLEIGGGVNDRPIPAGSHLRLVEIARATQSVAAAVLMVPNQPLEFHGDGRKRYEDDLIAYTWNRFFETGDPTWPARNPMVKSAVRAMDAVTEFLAGKDGGGVAIEKFVVAGASKRGWTTWLTGAADPRVAAIIPIVIDVLNPIPSMRHHHASYGFWAPAIDDYVEHDLMDRMDSPEMAALLRIVDPYEYRDRLAMPKYIVNATGDQFFLPDSWRFYYDELVGEKHLFYVPNAEHSLDGSNALRSMVAFYRMILAGAPRPRYSWSLGEDGSIRVRCEDLPEQVLLWQATNPRARDFRVDSIGRKFTSTPLEAVGGSGYVARVDPPKTGWTAFFLEMRYGTGSGSPLRLTTGVRIVPDRLPFADKK